MQITLVTIGSRGDVQPYIALGAGLAAAGHTVRLATNPGYAALVERHGLAFRPVHGDFRQVQDSAAGQATLHSGDNPIAAMRRFVAATRSMMTQLLADAWQACQGSEAIVYATFSFFAYHIAEKLGVPSVAAYLYPVTPTGDFPSIAAPAWPLGRGYNRLTYSFGQQVFWQPYRQMINEFRQRTLDLPPVPFFGIFDRLTRERYPIVCGYSPSFLPKPQDWGGWVTVTGYWFLPDVSGWTPPADLLAFLNAGAPPVYVGFGSMASRGSAAMTELVLAALRQAGHRGMLATGWGGLEAGAHGDDIFVLDAAPHEWLFPRMAAVVHHGGAGTTGAGLRAGVPSILTPFFGDQFFWARQVARRGLGPPFIPQKQLTAEKLAAAIRAATGDAAVVRQAQAMSKRIRAEDGVGVAVQTIERILQTTRP